MTSRTARTERNGVLLAILSWIFVALVAGVFLLEEAEVTEYRRHIEAVFTTR